MEPKDKDTQIIYDNDYCYVTDDGRLFQKASPFFNERHIADLEPGNVEEELKEYQKAFSELIDQVEKELGEAHTSDDIERLSDNIAHSEAVGDYAKIASRLDEAREAIASGGDDRGSGSDPGSDSGTDSGTEITEINEESETKTGAESKEQTESGSEPEAETLADPESKVTEEAESETKASAESESEMKSETETETTSEAEAGTRADSESKATEEAESETKEVATSETEVASEPEAETLADSELKVKAAEGSGSNVETEATAGAGNEKETETQSESKATAGEVTETDTGEKAEVKTDTDADADADAGSPDKAESGPDAGADLGAVNEDPASPEEQYYLDLVKKSREYSNLKDWSHTPQLFASVYDSWNEGPDLEESRKNELRNEVDKALEVFNQKKTAHFEYQKEKKQKNLDQREYLLDKLKKIVELKRWHATGEVNSIRRKWEDIKHLPSADTVQEQNKNFQTLHETFDENRVEYLVEQRRTEEENLAGKLMILDKMDELVKKAGPDMEKWENLNNEFNELTHQWRKIQNVPKEKEDEVWSHYKATREQFYANRAEHDEEFRKELERNVKVRKRLIRKAAELVEEKDLAKGVRLINKLHSDWKKSGMVPREVSDELWDEFKAASDAFNKLKAGNLDLIRDQENENYQQKVALCERAEAMSETDNWKAATDEMSALMAEWKTIGPVPRKKTNAVWTRFKRAMDVFYKNRRGFFKEARTEQKENLDKKRDIIAKIIELNELENPDEAIEKVKPLQEEFKNIGFVPLKVKNKIWQLYKDALDNLYEKARSAKRATSQSGGSSRSESDRSGRADRPDRPARTDRPERQNQQEIFRLRRECDELRNTIEKYSDSMTYIKPNKKGLELRQTIQNNIDETEARLKEKMEKIEQLSSEE